MRIMFLVDVVAVQKVKMVTVVLKVEVNLVEDILLVMVPVMEDISMVDMVVAEEPAVEVDITVVVEVEAGNWVVEADHPMYQD